MPAKPATAASRTSPYHSCKRPRIDLRINDVPLPPARGDEVLPELLADVRHVHLDEVRQRVLVLVEEVLVDFGAADEPAAVQGERLDEGVLAGGQRDLLAAAADGPGARVEAHVAEGDDGVRLPRRPPDEG